MGKLEIECRRSPFLFMYLFPPGASANRYTSRATYEEKSLLCRWLRRWKELPRLPRCGGGGGGGVAGLSDWAVGGDASGIMETHLSWQYLNTPFLLNPRCTGEGQTAQTSTIHPQLQRDQGRDICVWGPALRRAARQEDAKLSRVRPRAGESRWE